jgi:uncharacterized membrane protein YqjE
MNDGPTSTESGERSYSILVSVLALCVAGMGWLFSVMTIVQVVDDTDAVVQLTVAALVLVALVAALAVWFLLSRRSRPGAA